MYNQSSESRICGLTSFFIGHANTVPLFYLFVLLKLYVQLKIFQLL